MRKEHITGQAWVITVLFKSIAFGVLLYHYDASDWELGACLFLCASLLFAGIASEFIESHGQIGNKEEVAWAVLKGIFIGLVPFTLILGYLIFLSLGAIWRGCKELAAQWQKFKNLPDK